MTIKEDFSTSPSQYYGNDNTTQGGLADEIDLDVVDADSTKQASAEVETSTPQNYADGLDFSPPDANDPNRNMQGEYGEPPKTGQQYSTEKEQDIERADDSNTARSSSREDYSSSYELTEEEERRLRRNRRARGIGSISCILFLLFFFWFGRAWWWGRFMDDDGSQNDNQRTPDMSFAPSMAPSLAPEAEISTVPTNNN